MIKGFTLVDSINHWAFERARIIGLFILDENATGAMENSILIFSLYSGCSASKT